MEVRSIMARPRNDVPAYRKHASGQARVTINGRDYLLGPHESKVSKDAYDRLIAEWLSTGRSASFGTTSCEVSVAAILLGYTRFAKEYFGLGLASEYVRTKPVIEVLSDLYGTTLGIDFGPLEFKAVREHLLNATDALGKPKNLSRSYINTQMKRVRRIFRWAASEAMIPASIYQNLASVDPLKRGRCNAPETIPVKPVSDHDIQATLAHLGPVVSDMIRLQSLVGCRPGEVCRIKPSMVDRSGEVWEIHFDAHKTAYRGKKRTVYVGPKAQVILGPYLGRNPTEYCFSPKESERIRKQKKSESRKTPMSCGNKPGSNLSTNPKKAPGDCYTTLSYGKAIKTACKRAKIDPWAPNQIRHSVATNVRKNFGLDAAAKILGHSDVGVTQVYAEQDREKAIEVAKAMG
jgi:integrase